MDNARYFKVGPLKPQVHQLLPNVKAGEFLPTNFDANVNLFKGIGSPNKAAGEALQKAQSCLRLTSLKDRLGDAIKKVQEGTEPAKIAMHDIMGEYGSFGVCFECVILAVEKYCKEGSNDTVNDFSCAILSFGTDKATLRSIGLVIAASVANIVVVRKLLSTSSSDMNVLKAGLGLVSAVVSSVAGYRSFCHLKSLKKASLDPCFQDAVEAFFMNELIKTGDARIDDNGQLSLVGYNETD